MLARTRRLLADDPMNASAHFLQGLAALEAGDAQAAVVALRRALYADPRLGVAAFQLGRAYESLGKPAAARRAYEQALRTCEPEGDLHDPLLDQVELGDVVTAVKTRLEALSPDRRLAQASLRASPAPAGRLTRGRAKRSGRAGRRRPRSGADLLPRDGVRRSRRARRVSSTARSDRLPPR